MFCLSASYNETVRIIGNRTDFFLKLKMNFNE